MSSKSRIQNLRKELNQHNINYYVHDDPSISDAQYDRLLKELELLEKQYPKYDSDFSPTKRVGTTPLTDFDSVTHSIPMLSLANAMNNKDLKEFDTQIAKNLSTDVLIEYIGEPKLDGLAVELVYEKGNFIYGSTRGDGFIGENITENLKTIKGIPLTLNIPNIPDILEVRGEVFINHNDFKQLNKKRLKEGLSIFANPRNCAAGSLRQLDSKITASRPLRIFCYAPGVIKGIFFDSQNNFLDYLIKCGFPVNPYKKTGKGNIFLINYYQEIQDLRKNLPYDIDGVVFKINSYKIQKKVGERSRSPRWAIAGKFKAQQETTQILDIIISVGRTGALTPVAKLKPVRIGGVIVSNATLHNQDEINRKNISIGDTVLVQRAGDVIPEVIKVILHKRDNNKNPFKIPRNCPVCHSLAIRKKDDATFRCTNDSCTAKITGSIEHYVSKNSLNIDGLGIKIIDLLLSKKIIEDVGDLYNLNLEELAQLERLGEKSAQNIINAINKSKNTTLARFVNGLGIRNIGLNASKLLEKHFNGNLKDLMQSSKEELLAINEIGEIMADSIIYFFANNNNKLLIKKCVDGGLVFKSVKKIKNILMSDKTFVFTGTLKTMSRNDARKIIESYGAKSSSSVSQNTDYVVAGSGAGTKIEKAKQLSLLILNEAEFQQLIKNL